MQEFKNKNDYSIIVFDKDGNFILKWTYVGGLYKASQYLNSRYNWSYMNVYVRRSGRFLSRYYRGNYIPNKPKS